MVRLSREIWKFTRTGLEEPCFRKMLLFPNGCNYMYVIMYVILIKHHKTLEVILNCDETGTDLCQELCMGDQVIAGDLLGTVL